MPTVGFLDPTFGNNPTLPGRVLDQNIGGAFHMALQPDGKIVVVGTDYVDTPSFLVSRYNADGSLDDGGATDSTPGDFFGSEGRVVTEIGEWAAPTSVLVQPDGKIIAAGIVISADQEDFALARYNLDGSLDSGFGIDGKVVTDFGGLNDVAESVTLQPDGKIVAAGWATSAGDVNFALARYNPDGSLDSGFGVNGKVVTDFEGSTDIAESVAIQPDGKIVAAGRADSPETVHFGLARYNPNGSLDSDFDADGKVVTDFAGDSDQARSVVLQPDGKIVAVGETFSYVSQENDFALARYNPDGSLDTSFSFDGKATTDFGDHKRDEATSVVLQPDGKLVVAGSTETGGGFANFALARYTTDGDLDTSFNFDGKVATDFPDRGDSASSVALQLDGKILLAGNGGGNLALARYQGDPANRPPVIANQSFTINENSALGTVVGTVLASDPDPGQTLTYDITAGNTNGAFEIDTRTGQISVGKREVLDFETTPALTLTLRVTDNGLPALSSTATITIRLNDVEESLNRPPSIQQAEIVINENAANGTLVGTVAAVDPDAGQTLAYQIISGNTSDAFAIHSSTGQITVANSAALDFETTPVFTLTVQATDNGSPPLSTSATIVIRLTDDRRERFSRLSGAEQVVAKNKTLTFSRASGNDISSVIPDTGAVLIQVSLTALHGKLTLARTAGLTFQVGDGKNDRTLSFRGTSAAVKAALDGLTYSPVKGYVGTDRITVATYNQRTLSRTSRIAPRQAIRPRVIHEVRVVPRVH